MSLLDQLEKFVTEQKTAAGLYNLNPLEAAGKKKRAPKKKVEVVAVAPVVAVPEDVLIAGKKKRAPKKVEAVAVVAAPVCPMSPESPMKAGKCKKKRGPMSEATKAKLAGSAWNQEVKDMQKKHGVSLKEAMSMASKARKEKK